MSLRSPLAVAGMSTTIQCVSSIAGLGLTLFFFTIVGALPPFWQGGEAMLPLVLGVWTFVLGAIPFYLIAYALLALMKKNASLRTFAFIGSLQGVGFHPLSYVAVSLLRAAQETTTLSPSVAYNLGLAISGTLAALSASLIIAILSPRKYVI
jgi:hypothetical protein